MGPVEVAEVAVAAAPQPPPIYPVRTHLNIAVVPAILPPLTVPYNLDRVWAATDIIIAVAA